MAGEAHSTVGYDRLKCDATALTDSRDGRDVILLLNFNLPKRVLDDGEGELPRRLEEIVAFVTGNFGDQPPGHLFYQMSGTYWLRHRTNGTLTGPGFFKFDRQNFVQDGLQTLQPDNIYRAAAIIFLFPFAQDAL